MQNTNICIPIYEETYEAAHKSAKNAILAGADLIELRIDAIKNPDPDDVLKLIKDIEHPVIATNRKIEEGGLFDGSESERVEILLSAAKNADIIDIELQTNQEYLKKIVKAANSTIVSYHDFNRTPSVEFLLDIVEREKDIGDIAKFAVMPNKMSDTLIVLDVLSRVDNTVGISMGDMGTYTRFIAPLFGSPITFASLGNKSAPGQIDIEITKNILHELGNR